MGNAGKDGGVTYIDAGIKREGVQGQSVDGEFSSGRGGAGNVRTTLLFYKLRTY